MLKRLGCLGVIALVIAGLWSFMAWRGDGPAEASLKVSIPDGASLRSAAHLLEERGAIRSAGGFVRLAKLFGGGEAIKSGQYRIKAHESAADILKQLQSGKTLQQLVTIPEGMPSVMVRDRLLAAADLTGDVPVPDEGSVLPDSYAYDAGEPRAAVLKRMQAAMRKTLAQLWAERSNKTAATSPAQAIILASIVEKETALARERPLVAGVYGNRLKRGMKLQADPTVIYPVTKGRPLGRRIRKSELTADNGYNTYLKPGLPAGPIANPGKAAIAAVLNPADTKALFFVADGKGGHVFSDTNAGQNANVQKWFALRRARGEM